MAAVANLFVQSSFLAFLLLLQLPPSGQSKRLPPSCQPPLVVFGASMVDVGENAEVLPLRSAAEFLPYGVDYFRRPAARFSNGRLIIDFISQGLGYGLLDPFLNSVEPNFAHGVNFASSGSTARNSTVKGNGTDSSGLFSLTVQIDQFKRFKAKTLLAQSRNGGSSQRLISATGFSEAIHFIETAHNDYISTAFLTSDFDPLSAVLATISAMEYALRELYSAGARNIIVMNVIPLGCTPGFLAASSTGALKLTPTLDKDGCLAEYNDLVNLHNHHLEKLLESLSVELPLKNLILFDAYAIYLDAIRHPSKYGVKHPFQACCGGGGGEYNLDIGCGKSGYINGTMVEGKRCEDPLLYISWDGLHPVESFAKHIADGVLTGKYLKPKFLIQHSCKH